MTESSSGLILNWNVPEGTKKIMKEPPHPKNGGSKFLQNIGILSHHSTRCHNWEDCNLNKRPSCEIHRLTEPEYKAGVLIITCSILSTA
jgi:hypothetical protein